MRAVAKTAVAADAENLRKIMAHFLALKIYRTKTLDTRRVYHSAVFQEIHLAESGGMHTFVVGVGDLTGTRDLAAKKRIE